MPSKAEITSAYIIKTVAPVFNKKGYSGTSMQDITLATGLTKGAIYGNFKNKNELAIKSFIYNINLITTKIEDAIVMKKTALGKLYAITDFYKAYYRYTLKFGGCPILNIGIDANHQNPDLLEKVKKAIRNIQNNITKIIEFGIKSNEIKPTVDASFYSRIIFSRIEGAVFMSMTSNNEIYMEDMIISLEQMIKNELEL